MFGYGYRMLVPGRNGEQYETNGKAPVFRWVQARLRDVRRFRTAFRNYPTAILNTVLQQTPFTAILRDGTTVFVTNPVLGYNLSLYVAAGWNYNPTTGSVTFRDPRSGRWLTFEGADCDGDLLKVFSGEYDWLDVRGRCVVDIGGSIADSSINFALRGATKVFSIEPFPDVSAYGAKNVRSNGFESIVEVIPVGCGGSDCSKSMPADRTLSVGRNSVDPRNGKAVKVRTLATLVGDLDPPSDSVLKMDCEGCEYEAIEASDTPTLRRFKQIQMEYHYGSRPLIDKLKMAGFEVSLSGPEFSCSVYLRRSWEAGMIRASRRGPA